MTTKGFSVPDHYGGRWRQKAKIPVLPGKGKRDEKE